jgi:hypothetical protein
MISRRDSEYRGIVDKYVDLAGTSSMGWATYHHGFIAHIDYCAGHRVDALIAGDLIPKGCEAESVVLMVN